VPPTRNGTVLLAGAVLAGLLLAGLPGSASASAKGRSAPSPSAAIARSISVREFGTLRLVSHHGSALTEEGRGSGTFKCSFVVHFTVSPTSTGVSFLCKTSRGSIAGSGRATFYAAGAIGHFKGNLAVRSGTGSYARASASALHLEGTINRQSYAATIRVEGTMSA
jgi:hypothetical protein